MNSWKHYGQGDVGWMRFIQHFAIGARAPLETSLNSDLIARTSLARAILNECYGLLVETAPGPLLRSPIHFEPQIGIDHAEDVRGLSELLGTLLIPIGEVQSESIILLSETGHVYLLGFVGCGVIQMGNTLSEGVEALFCSRRGTTLKFDDSVDRIYRWDAD